MITVLVLVSLVALFGLCLPNLFRPMTPPASADPCCPADPYPASDTSASPEAAAGHLSGSGPASGPVTASTLGPAQLPGVHPESMTAELDPYDEEYLACLADELWPDDEYLAPEQTSDGEEESGGSGMRL